MFTSNAFAILGLRSLYFLLADMHARFRYLQQGLAVILAFVGVKMIIIALVSTSRRRSRCSVIVARAGRRRCVVLAAGATPAPRRRSTLVEDRSPRRRAVTTPRGSLATVAIVDEDIERLRSTVSIVDVVQQYVALRTVGRNWVGLCPFHAEKTPSFNVREETGRYKCFGCGQRATCSRSSRRSSTSTSSAPSSSWRPRPASSCATPTRRRERGAPAAQAAVEAMAHGGRVVPPAAARRRPTRAPARDYLRSRGLAGDVARQFKLGWAPDDWDALSRDAGACRPMLLRDTGLAFPNQAQPACRTPSGRGCCSRSSPRTATRWRFGGRILPGSTDPAKYKNSPETPIYTKSQTLYGLNWAKADIVAPTR